MRGREGGRKIERKPTSVVIHLYQVMGHEPTRRLTVLGPMPTLRCGIEVSVNGFKI